MSIWEHEQVVSAERLKSAMRKHQVTSAQGLIDILYDSKLNDYESEYIVVRLKDESKTKWWQRVNCLWCLPLVSIYNTIMWFKTGNSGVNRYSKFGHILTKLIGE